MPHITNKQTKNRKDFFSVEKNELQFIAKPFKRYVHDTRNSFKKKGWKNHFPLSRLAIKTF